MVDSEQRFGHVAEWRDKLNAQGWWHSFELPDGRVIEGAHSVEGLKGRLAQFDIPEDLRGKRALDIGTWDGWFAFELERRGAEVIAIDMFDNPRFRQIHAWTNSKIDYRRLNVYDLDPRKIGQFDVVLFMGVLYHLKHPLLALEKVCAVCRGMAAVESYTSKDPEIAANPRPIFEFFETDEFGGQADNWNAPNVACMRALCHTGGFARAELVREHHFGAAFNCYRKWEGAENQTSPAPVLTTAFHHLDYGINFASGVDDYIVCWFESLLADLTIGDIRPEVSGFGIKPMTLLRRETNWVVSFMLPPGLASGWHDVRLRIGDSALSNAVRIAVDLPPQARRLQMVSVTDGTTWKPDTWDLSKGSVVSAWLKGLPENADIANVRARLGDWVLTPDYVEPMKDPTNRTKRQVNFRAAEDVKPGKWALRIECGGATVKKTLRVTA